MSDDVETSVKAAEEKSKRAAEAQKVAEQAVVDASRSSLSPEQLKVDEARIVASKAASDAAQAFMDVQQARGNVALERKIGRKLTKGEHCRWVNGDRTDNKQRNLELCSPLIEEMEAKTRHNVDGESMEPFDEAAFVKSHAVRETPEPFLAPLHVRYEPTSTRDDRYGEPFSG